MLHTVVLVILLQLICYLPTRIYIIIQSFGVCYHYRLHCRTWLCEIVVILLHNASLSRNAFPRVYSCPVSFSSYFNPVPSQFKTYIPDPSSLSAGPMAQCKKKKKKKKKKKTKKKSPIGHWAVTAAGFSSFLACCNEKGLLWILTDTRGRGKHGH